jgi:aspartyl protease family protein
MILAAFMVGLGTIMAQVADRMTLAPAQANSVSLKVAAVETSTQTAGQPPAMPAAISRPRGGSTVSASAS